MHGLAVLSPINEAEELSPYRTRFGYPRFPGQRSPIGNKNQIDNVRDTVLDSKPEVTMDDLWIYDCYASEDTTSPVGYPHSPTTPLHNRSISLPTTTVNYVPPNDAPLIREPVLHRPSPLNLPSRPLPRPPLQSQPDPVLEASDDPTDTVEVDYTELDLPVINTAVFSPAEFPEYSPLEQEVLSVWEVIDQLTTAADVFSAIESTLSHASPDELPPDMDEDVTFWFIEALNIFVGDCKEVAADLVNFAEFVEALVASEQELAFVEIPRLARASFSERDMKEVLETAASLAQAEVEEELAMLEESVLPAPEGERRWRDRPPSLKLSTNDVVLLQARMPRSRLQSVGAVGRFTEKVTGEEQPEEEVLKKHRAYVIYGDVTPVEDNWSAKSIVDYDAVELPFGKNGESQSSAGLAAYPRPNSGQSTLPRPLSSPVTFGGKSVARRPPSLTLSDPHSPRSSHSASSSVSSLFSALPRSSFTTTSSPRTSPRQSITLDKSDKPRFPTSSGNFKKMFSNIFKKKEKEGSSSPRPASRPFGKRLAGTGSLDATLTALSLSTIPTPSALDTGRDPFAATPPSSAGLPSLNASLEQPQTVLGDYSSMFNPVKAASRYPPQPLFGGVGEEQPI